MEIKRRSIKANFIFQFLYQTFVALVPLVTAPYLARTLGPEGVGIYGFNYAITYFFVLFTKLGIDNYGAKLIAEIDINNRAGLSKVFWQLFNSKLILGVISLAVYLAYVAVFVSENRIVAVIFALYIVSAILDINWFYVGIEEFRLISIRNIIVKLITVICIFLFVHSYDDLNKYTLIMVSGSYLLSQFIGWGFVIKKLDYVRPSIHEAVVHYKPLFMLFIPVLAMSIYRQMDKIMLGAMTDNVQVGLYEYTEKIYLVLMCVVSVCGDVGMPRIVSLHTGNKDKEAYNLIEKFMDFAMFMSFAMAFGISAISDKFIVLFYGESFAECAELLSKLAPAIVFLSISVIIRKEYLIPYGKEKVFIVATSMGAALNLILNMLFIPVLKAEGAIIATVVTELFVMVYQIVAVRKELPIAKYSKHALCFVSFGLVMYVLIKLIFREATQEWKNVIAEIIFGMVIYLVLSAAFLFKVYKDEAGEIIMKFRRKKND